jgi:hypothetical protein
MNVMRDVGEMGESTFKQWCASVGLIANVSIIDKTGWDFFVEFPMEGIENIPRDMYPPPMECKVQVKSTNNRNRKLAIKISNLHRLIRVPLPVFFCFIEFDGKLLAQSAFLVHIGKELISRTLKRIRELDIEGTGNALNKKTITINYGEKERLKDTSGESLKQAIEGYIPVGLEKYNKEKNKFLKEVGFENGTAKITVAISGTNPIEDMVDLTLGLKNKIEVDGIIGYHKRFDITSNQPFVDEQGGELFVESKPLMKAKIKFKEYESSPYTSFDANIYNSPLNKIIPKQYVKVKIECGFVQLVVKPFLKRIEYFFSPKFEERVPLKELRDELKVITLFKKTSGKLIIEIETENHPPFPFNLSGYSGKVDDFSGPYKISEMCMSICQRLGIPENEVSVSLRDLVKHSNSINNFYGVIFSKELMGLQLRVDGSEFEAGAKVACLNLIYSTIGDKIVGCIISFFGELTLLDNSLYQYEIKTRKILIDSPLVVKEGEMFDQRVIESRVEKLAQQIEQKDITLIDFTKNVKVEAASISMPPEPQVGS